MGIGLKQGSFQSPQQLLWEENSWGAGGLKDVFSGCADSFVDQLLNLNADNSQEVDPLVDKQDQETQEINSDGAASLPPPPPLQLPQPTSAEDDLGPVINIPEEEPDLVWLSLLVEDSFSQYYPTATGCLLPPANPMPESETQKTSFGFSPPVNVPRSRRSKRPRSAVPFSGHFWPLAAPLAGSSPSSSSLTESTTTSTSSSSATSSPYPPTSPSTPLAFQLQDPGEHPNRKKKQKGWTRPGSSSGSASLSRRCSHCGTQKTPQWRVGPMGAKTLCNACGVRFKSGRLLPEYRPACSPTFSNELHSNSHRKVLEMRRKKELMDQDQPESGFCPAVTSFG